MRVLHSEIGRRYKEIGPTQTTVGRIMLDGTQHHSPEDQYSDSVAGYLSLVGRRT
jgi:hypothetical protein